MRVARLLLLLVLAPAPAHSSETADAEIRAVIAQWYEELAKKEDGRPDFVIGSPYFPASSYYRHIDNGSAALGPRVYVSLTATALQFRYDIGFMRIDPNFARVGVVERGYFYAALAQKTYERHADSDFILERRQKDGEWRVVAYRTGSYGIAPGRETDPMPDLRDLYYATEGRDRDPEADAREAGKF